MGGNLLADRAASADVTPHAQNTGVSPSRIVTASPKSTCAMSRMPMAAGSPMWTGRPCASAMLPEARDADHKG